VVDREVRIVNRLGLHARAAAKFVQLAGTFSSRVRVARDGEAVDGKSILGLLLLAAAQGQQVILSCDGPDEPEALEQLAALVESGFYEETDEEQQETA